MKRELPSTPAQIDELVEVITDPKRHCDEQSRALHLLEEVAGTRATKVCLGVPLRPDTLPEMEVLR